MAKNIAAFMAEVKKAKETEIKAKAEYKEKKMAMVTEYIDNMPAEVKAKQIEEAKQIVNTAKVELEKKVFALKVELKKAKAEFKEKFSFAKELLSFVNYKQNNSLPKIKNQKRIEGNFLVFNREGIKEIRIDITKSNWEKTFKIELAKQGINGENRIADNLVYTCQLLLKAKNIKTE